jgi:mannitol operon transcriptional antiterminator
MYLSARERKILEALLLKHEETTVKQLSNELDVSARTIHRDLKGVEDILKEFKLELKKKSGSGIKVIGEQESREKLQLFLFNLSHNEYTPEERQTIILSELLDKSEPVKLLSLANDLNVTIASISNDLNKIEERIVPFGLSLLRKRGYGVEINGDESGKRKVMSKLILDNLDEFGFISMIKENIQRKSTSSLDTITDRLLDLVDKKKLLVIEKQINAIKGDLPYTIADSAYIGLVVHLALAIERIQQGEEIIFDEENLETIKGTKEFEVAKQIVSALEEVFRLTISHGEVGYITMHLMGAKLRTNHDNLLEDTTSQLGINIQQLIRFVSQKLNFDLTDNLSLFHGLIAHFRPALYRIKQNMGITNPLLPKIKQDYGELFSCIDEGVKEIFPDLHIPEEEIGYLVMHFGSALLKNNDVKEFKTLVVCSSGIGTSKILSTKLQKEIPGLKTVNVSLFELDKYDKEDFDIIISTVPLLDNDEYILVSPLLSQVELEQVKRRLVENESVSKKDVATLEIRKDKVTAQQFLNHIEKVKHCSTAIHQLLKGFSVTSFSTPFTRDNALQHACKSLKSQQIISNEDEVLGELLRREHVGGLGIPGTKFALYHARSDYCEIPSFTIYRLAEPILVKAMDDTTTDIDSILLMVCPMDTNSETLEALSAISSLIIRDEETIKLFSSANHAELLELITAELQALYDVKLTK